MNRRGKELRLERLKNPECKLCKLCKSSQHVCILGKGNVMAPIVLIGEAPGKAEVQTGKPFMGRAGKLLDRVLQAIDIADMVYITNAVRCRPPENRDPTNAELEACHYYLKREIDIIKPKVVVLLGKVAVKSLGLSGDVNVDSSYFYYTPWPNAWVRATWHPAYCLRKRGDTIKTLAEHLSWAKSVAKEKENETS